MMRALSISALATMLAAIPALAAPALAAPVTENFTILASGFSDVLGSTNAPSDPVSLTVALSFDPATGDQFDYSTGLRLLGSSVPVSGGFAFDYDSGSDTLTFGGAGLGGVGITAGTNDLLAVINTPYSGTPTFGGFIYTNSAAAGVYESFTGSVQVPEPASIALMLTGLAAIGCLRRRA